LNPSRRDTTALVATSGQSTVATMYAQFGPTIYARCMRLLKDPAAAEDATQDVFLKVLRHLESAPQIDGALPWIYRITTNHCLNVIRDSKRTEEPVIDGLEVADGDVEAEVVAKDFLEKLLVSTPEEFRRPAVLYHGQGIEQGQVAKMLGVSRRTVLYRLAEFTKRAMQMEKLVSL
jgi:RNA polymerase sigma-70 factor, ECF subfamily